MIAAEGDAVANIRKGREDRHGNRILEVYQRKDGEYAVYLTATRVMVQFADNVTKAREQRLALAPLLPLRDEVDGLIQGWRDPEIVEAGDLQIRASQGSDHLNAAQTKSRGFFGLRDPARLRNKVACQDRRVSGALVQALEDDEPGARLWLEKIRGDVINERTAFARFEYLLTAFTTSLMVLFAAWLLSSLLPYEGNRFLPLNGTLINVSLILLAASSLVAMVGAGLVAAGRWHPAPGAGMVFAIAAVPLLALAIWALIAWNAPSALVPGTYPVQRSTALGLVVLLLASTIALALATAHQPASPRRTALVFATFAIPLFAMLVWPQTSVESVAKDYLDGVYMWRAFAAGAVGAFFSISIGIKGRTVLPDLLRTANMMDAVLRVSIGAIGGAVLEGLLRGHVVQFNLMPPDNDLLPVVAGFFAGFSERLVPDLLAKVGEKPAEFDARLAASRAQRQVRVERQGEAVRKTEAEGRAAPPVAEHPVQAAAPSNDNVDDRDAEVGAAGFMIEDDEVTNDEDLPAAMGGVARS